MKEGPTALRRQAECKRTLLWRFLLPFETGQVLDDDSPAVHFEVALGLKPPEVPRHQLAHGAKLGREVLLGLEFLDCFNWTCPLT